jgi:hypothetical protein
VYTYGQVPWLFWYGVTWLNFGSAEQVFWALF